LSFEKLCPVHRGPIAMSGWVAPQFSTAKSPLENFAMRTYPHKPQGKLVRLFVDKKQIGLEVALAMVRIFTR
jgi:hypothetical protein